MASQQKQNIRKYAVVSAVTFLFLISPFPAARSHASTAASEFLCEIGLKFYQQGNYDEALHEFKKALMVSPDYEPAINYIRIIEEQLTRERIEGAAKAKEGARRPVVLKGVPLESLPAVKPAKKAEPVVPKAFKTTSPVSSGAMRELLDLLEIQQEMIAQHQERMRQEAVRALPEIMPSGAVPQGEAGVRPISAERKRLPPIITTMDELLKAQKTYEIEQGQEIIVQSRGITRFLATYPETLLVTKNISGDLSIVGVDTGYSDLIIWDDTGRHMFEFLVLPPKPKGPFYADILKKGIEREEGFSLSYSMDWVLYEQGRRLNTLSRDSYTYIHNIILNGPTPYGKIDSTATVEVLGTQAKKSTDVIYATVGLTEGLIGPFKNFTLRGLDYSPRFSNLSFSGESLRGVMLDSPAFDSKVQYTTFWGREGGGRYGTLSPGLAKIKHQFMGGGDVAFKPTEHQRYEMSVLHGWGRGRPDYLNAYGYDASAKYLFDKWNTGYELAFDTERFAQLFNFERKLGKGDFSFEFRNINKDFHSMTGLGNRAGEIGGLVSLNYQPTDKLTITDQVNIFKDRLYPSEENPKRLNYDNTWGLSYTINEDSSVSLDHTFQNELGRLSEFRYSSGGMVYSKSFDFIKKISTYVGGRYQKAQYMSSHAQDYVDKKAMAGLSFNVIGNLNFSLTKEYNWLEQTATSIKTKPQALDARLNWGGNIPQSNFFVHWYLSYRDEEDTGSPVTFLSGQDYLDNYSEVSYRPNKDTEVYFSNRFRNSWAEKEDVSKYMEVDFNAGLRYVWDTGFRWEPVGSIEGYVFKDLNLDGLRQRDEAPIENIKVFLGKDKFSVTDIFGYFRFDNVRGRNATVTIDDATIPKGFVLTTPISQTVRIMNKKKSVISFGMAAPTEITGIVFVDEDGSGKYEQGKKTVSGVLLVLENGKIAKTDAYGSYTFINPSAGEHTMTLKLESLPVQYLPAVPLKKDIVVYEGITYNYDIPLKQESEN